MDALLAVLHPNSPLPYEDSAPPGLFTSVLHQLWGVVRGGSALQEDRRVEGNMDENGDLYGHMNSNVDMNSYEENGGEGGGGEERRVSLDPSAKPWCPVSTTATDVTPAQRMTAAMLDLQLVDDDEDVREGSNEAEHCGWQFGFGDGFGGDKFGIGKGTDSRTDDDKDMLFTEEICKDLPHVTVAMLGHFKGDIGVDQHLISLANESVSGLKTRWWIEKLVSVCEAEGQVHGPAFASAYGILASSADYNAVFRKYLGQVQDKTDFIPGETDVDAQYSTFRTPRKSSTTRLEHAGFGDKFVDRMNR